jgi:hypothetical protein
VRVIFLEVRRWRVEAAAGAPRQRTIREEWKATRAVRSVARWGRQER